MLTEYLLFRRLAASDYRGHDQQHYRSFCRPLKVQCWDDCRCGPSISEVLPSAQVSRAFWGQQWGQHASVWIELHSEVRFPPPPPEPLWTSVDVDGSPRTSFRQVAVRVSSIPRLAIESEFSSARHRLQSAR